MSVLGGGQGPAPLSVSASKHDGDRKNMFVWSMSSALDGSGNALLYKGMLGYWLDENSLRRYGFSSEQVTTSVFSRTDLKWLGQEIPRVLARVAYQKAPLPYLWNHQRHYPLLPGARPGTVLEDTTDNVVGYITSVSHQIQAGSPGTFRAATTLTVERVIEDPDGITRESYPDKMRAFLTGLKHQNYVQGFAEQTVQQARNGKAAPAGGWVRVSPVTRSASSYGLTPSTHGDLGAARGYRCGIHNAVDYGMVTGTPLYFPLGGNVLQSGFQNDGAGNFIRFQCDDGSTHMFAHLNGLPPFSNGQRFETGASLVVASGATGHSVGPHLHWQIFLPGSNRAIDPVQWLQNGGTVS